MEGGRREFKGPSRVRAIISPSSLPTFRRDAGSPVRPKSNDGNVVARKDRFHSDASKSKPATNRDRTIRSPKEKTTAAPAAKALPKGRMLLVQPRSNFHQSGRSANASSGGISSLDRRQLLKPSLESKKKNSTTSSVPLQKDSPGKFESPPKPSASRNVPHISNFDRYRGMVTENSNISFGQGIQEVIEEEQEENIEVAAPIAEPGNPELSDVVPQEIPVAAVSPEDELNALKAQFEESATSAMEVRAQKPVASRMQRMSMRQAPGIAGTDNTTASDTTRNQRKVVVNKKNSVLKRTSAPKNDSPSASAEGLAFKASVPKGKRVDEKPDPTHTGTRRGSIANAVRRPSLAFKGTRRASQKPEPVEPEPPIIEEVKEEPPRRVKKFAAQNLLSAIRIVQELSDKVDAEEDTVGALQPADMNQSVASVSTSEPLPLNSSSQRDSILSSRLDADLNASEDMFSSKPVEVSMKSGYIDDYHPLRRGRMTSVGTDMSARPAMRHIPIKMGMNRQININTGSYLGHKINPYHNYPPFPSPTRNQLLYGPYDEALHKALSHLHINHPYETLDYFYSPLDSRSFNDKPILPFQSTKTKS